MAKHPCRICGHIGGRRRHQLCAACGVAKASFTKLIKSQKAFWLFIEGSKYLYDLTTVYLGHNEKLALLRNDHGQFWTTPYDIMCRTSGCQVCGKELAASTNIHNRKRTFMERLSKRLDISKYDFSKLIYHRNNIKSTVICTLHGKWQTTPNSLLSRHGCPICAHEHASWKMRSSRITRPATVYVIYLPEVGLYKIGVTTGTVKERYRKESVKYIVVVEVFYMTELEAYNVERYLLYTSYTTYKITYSVFVGGGNTELRSEVPLLAIMLSRAEEHCNVQRTDSIIFKF